MIWNKINSIFASINFIAF